MEKRTTQSNNNLFQSNTPATQEGGGKVPAQQWLASVKNKIDEIGTAQQFEALLPSSMPVARFLGSLWLYVKDAPDIWGKCSPNAILREALYAAQQGLDFGIPNECHLVPFGSDVSLIRGYKGDLKMARRNPRIAFVDANEVREKDSVEIELGDRPGISHKRPPFGSDRGKIVGFYAVARDVAGGVYVYTMDNNEVWAHAKQFTKAFKNGPFAEIVEKGPNGKNWSSYGYKTVVIALCTKKLDMSSEMGEQIHREWAAESPVKGAIVEKEKAKNTDIEIEAGQEVEIEPPAREIPASAVAAAEAKLKANIKNATTEPEAS